MPEVVWQPDAETLERANVVRLMRRHGLDDYRELVQRSIDDPEWFWPAAVEDLGIEFAERWTQVLDASRGPEWTTWFVNGKLNIAWNCVHRWAAERPRRRRPCSAARTVRDGAVVRRAFVAGHEARRSARAAGRRSRRPCSDLPSDVSGGRRRFPRLRAHRRRAGADLLRLRRAGRRAAPRRLRGEGRDHRRELAAPRREIPMLASLEGETRGANARARGARPVRRAARRLSRRARASRSRLGAPVSAHVHIRHDRPSQGRIARPGRLPRLHRARGRLPGRRPSRRRHPLRHRHGLDHGPVDGGRRRRDGRHDRLRRGCA